MKTKQQKKLFPILQSQKCLFKEPLRPLRKFFMLNITKKKSEEQSYNQPKRGSTIILYILNKGQLRNRYFHQSFVFASHIMHGKFNFLNL